MEIPHVNGLVYWMFIKVVEGVVCKGRFAKTKVVTLSMPAFWQKTTLEEMVITQRKSTSYDL